MDDEQQEGPWGSVVAAPLELEPERLPPPIVYRPQSCEPVPASPLDAIIERLYGAAKQLANANERLAGASGRLGTDSPGYGVAGCSDQHTEGPGFVCSANERISELFGVIEATERLAQVFDQTI
jgi:hypothetical protein